VCPGSQIQATRVGGYPCHTKQSTRALAQAFIARGSKPRKVLLKDGSLFADVFEKIGKGAGIQCKRCDDLPHIADFINSMDEAMENGSFPGGLFKN
jgi:hypothetical protein